MEWAAWAAWTTNLIQTRFKKTRPASAGRVFLFLDCADQAFILASSRLRARDSGLENFHPNFSHAQPC